MTKRTGKIVYRPPERCYTKVNIEETEHGYKIYRLGMEDAFTFIPFGSVIQIEYWEE
tara:strand:- start:1964 stop:2134 length:171 start_codon:yes stop_codon:yes gene_type:complete